MKTNLKTCGFLLSFGLMAGSVQAQTAGLNATKSSQPAFEVKDIPPSEPIEGQLGEPGAPELKAQQEKLARSMLEKGICNASYFGEEFCAKQSQKKTFRVTDQFGSITSPNGKDTSRE